MLIVIAAVLILLAGVFYADMVVSGKQDDTWQDDMEKTGGHYDSQTKTWSV